MQCPLVVATDAARKDSMENKQSVTANEMAYIMAIFNSEYQDGVDGSAWVWAWSPATAFGKSAGGIASSLKKKGLAQTDGNAGEEACIRLTAAGLELARAAAAAEASK